MPNARDPRAAGAAPRDDDRRPRGRLTGRAAILALVVCAIALALAYPVREYIAQRQEIAELRHRERLAYREVQRLAEHKQRLSDEEYIKREARRRLHYCMPGEKCYIVLEEDTGDVPQQTGPARKPPWYETLWRSVRAADRP